MSQVRITKTRAEALKDEFVKGTYTQKTFDWLMDALLELGVADDPCPYAPRTGFRFHDDLPLPTNDPPSHG